METDGSPPSIFATRDLPTLPLGEARDALQRWADELDRILSAGKLKGSAVE